MNPGAWLRRGVSPGLGQGEGPACQSPPIILNSRSEYARHAIEEMNHRVMRERIAELSKQLSAESTKINRALDDATQDGLNA